MLDQVAKDYVKLVLELGLYDPDFVDAYHGPKEWKPNSQAKDQFPLEDFRNRVGKLQNEFQKAKSEQIDNLELKRQISLEKHLLALAARIEFMGGNRFSFDEEARAFYDVEVPHFSADYFEKSLARLDTVLPGSGDISSRYQQFKKPFEIPKDKLSEVFKTALLEGKKIAAQYIKLPEGDSFEIEYVNNQPWSGYNWFKGNASSLIQVNTDLEIYIDRAIDLACHEAYPGHHLHHSLVEAYLLKEKAWMEFSVHALFSPISFVAEGVANYGVKLAFPKEERILYEEETLFPLAGFDPKLARPYYKVLSLLQKLSYAGNEAARGYLDQKITRQEATDWLQRYSLMSPERAEQRLKFIERYRSYVINYNLGQDVVEQYIEAKVAKGSGGKAEKWKAFGELLSTPCVASFLLS